MSQCTNHKIPFQVENVKYSADLESVLKDGARTLLQLAIEAEVAEYLEIHKDDRDSSGRRLVVRNGHHKERDILTSMGPVHIKQPRVDDRKLGLMGCDRFTSQLLPRYMRKAPSIENLLPILYLKGISTQDFPTALAAILGDSAKGLSATTVVRLKEQWMDQYNQWSKRDLSSKRYIYIWADGVYFNVRLNDSKPCILTIIGADEQGNKELLAIVDGERESEISWTALLVDLKSRGLTMPPSLAIADGALGFWAALDKIYPGTAQQRCWVHKTRNVLDKLPKKLHSQAKEMIVNMYMAAGYAEAVSAYKQFGVVFGDKYPKAVECLEKDFDQLFTFYSFPAIHWIHIRTTNPIESTFATVRLRARRTKGCGSRDATLTMVFQLCREAQKRWKRLKGAEWLHFVAAGEQFIDGQLADADNSAKNVA